MKISNHAFDRMKQRRIIPEVANFMERFVPSTYGKGSNQIVLDRKTASKLAKKLRKTAENIEKNIGTKLILDPSGETMITAYKKY